MRRNRSVVVCIIWSAVVLGGSEYSATRAQDSPRVLKAVAPASYPPLAAAAMVKGKVKIEVKVDPGGDVISTRVIDGQKLLEDISKTAALRWKFVRDEEGKERSAQLTFRTSMD